MAGGCEETDAECRPPKTGNCLFVFRHSGENLLLIGAQRFKKSSRPDQVRVVSGGPKQRAQLGGCSQHLPTGRDGQNLPGHERNGAGVGAAGHKVNFVFRVPEASEVEFAHSDHHEVAAFLLMFLWGF